MANKAVCRGMPRRPRLGRVLCHHGRPVMAETAISVRPAGGVISAGLALNVAPDTVPVVRGAPEPGMGNRRRGLVAGDALRLLVACGAGFPVHLRVLGMPPHPPGNGMGGGLFLHVALQAVIAVLFCVAGDAAAAYLRLRNLLAMGLFPERGVVERFRQLKAADMAGGAVFRAGNLVFLVALDADTHPGDHAVAGNLFAVSTVLMALDALHVSFLVLLVVKVDQGAELHVFPEACLVVGPGMAEFAGIGVAGLDLLIMALGAYLVALKAHETGI